MRLMYYILVVWLFFLVRFLLLAFVYPSSCHSRTRIATSHHSASSSTSSVMISPEWHWIQLITLLAYLSPVWTSEVRSLRMRFPVKRPPSDALITIEVRWIYQFLNLIDFNEAQMWTFCPVRREYDRDRHQYHRLNDAPTVRLCPCSSLTGNFMSWQNICNVSKEMVYRSWGSSRVLRRAWH